MHQVSDIWYITGCNQAILPYQNRTHSPLNDLDIAHHARRIVNPFSIIYLDRAKVKKVPRALIRPFQNCESVWLTLTKDRMYAATKVFIPHKWLLYHILSR